MGQRVCCSTLLRIAAMLLLSGGVSMAQDAPAAPQQSRGNAQSSAQSAGQEWKYGAFADLGYLLDFNHPANKIFRSRGTAWHTDAVHLNMSGAYLKKQATEQSRWGIELTGQFGKDAELFGLSATAPNIAGYQVLRQFGPNNASYLAPIGNGFTVQGGIFVSLIGYDSLYAKDNFEYTRPWGADYTPCFMMGVNASYPFTGKLTGTAFLINGYWHLANANSVPSWGGQIAYKPDPCLTLKQTVFTGPTLRWSSGAFSRTPLSSVRPPGSQLRSNLSTRASGSPALDVHVL